MYPKDLVVLAAVCLAVTLLAVTFALHTSKAVLAASTATPAYTESGDMLPPGDYRGWIFLSSGIDMNYFPKAAGM